MRDSDVAYSGNADDGPRVVGRNDELDWIAGRLFLSPPG